MVVGAASWGSSTSFLFAIMLLLGTSTLDDDDDDDDELERVRVLLPASEFRRVGWPWLCSAV